MHASVAPKEVEVTGHHRDLRQFKQTRPIRFPEKELSNRVIQDDLIDQVEKIGRSNRPGVRRHDQLTG